jgi:TPR repeat protein
MDPQMGWHGSMLWPSPTSKLLAQQCYMADLISSAEYKTGSRRYNSLIVRQQRMALESMNALVSTEATADDASQHLPPGMSCRQFVQMLQEALQGTEQAARATVMPLERGETIQGMEVFQWLCKGSLALGLSHGLLNAHGNTEEYRKWLRVAALLGHPEAIYEATLMSAHESSASTHPTHPFPTRLYLSLLALSGFELPLQLLHDKWPDFYSMVLRVIGENKIELETIRWHYQTNGFRSLGRFLSKALSLYLPKKPYEFPLSFILLASQGFDTVAQLSKGSVKTTRLDGDDHAANILLHSLSRLPDGAVAGLARRLCRGKADLEFEDSIHSSFLPKIEGSALLAAVLRGKMSLSRSLLSLHIDLEVPIAGDNMILACAFCLLDHELGQSLLRLIREHPLMSVTASQEPNWLEPGLTATLHLVLYPSSPMILPERRAMHGDKYDEMYAESVRALLSAGADPCGLRDDRPGLESPLYFLLTDDDLASVQIIIDHLKESGLPKRLSFDDSSHPCIGAFEGFGAKAIRVCMTNNSPACLAYLLGRFPEASLDVDAKGLTLLHTAAESQTDGHLEVVQALINAGADVLAVDSRGLTPLGIALLNGLTSIADLLGTVSLQLQMARDPATGQSVFLRLIQIWKLADAKVKSNILAGCRWLADHGGLHFYGHGQAPVWKDILCHFRPPRRSDQLQYHLLLEFLLQFEPYASRINEDRYLGLTMLHAAVCFAHHELVELLVQRGATVNAPIDGSQSILPPNSWHGCTSLDVVAFYFIWLGRGPPMASNDSAINDGSIDTKQWMREIDSMIHTLLNHGAESANNMRAAM